MIGNVNMVIIGTNCIVLCTVIGNVSMVIIGTENITYDMLDAPQVLRSSQELQTLLSLPEQLPGSRLP